MIVPVNAQDAERAAALRRYQILDTPRESDFDDIVALCSRLCDAPISLISLIDTDRQWFKAEVGFGRQDSPLETSLCAHATLTDDFLEIPDTLADPRSAENPMCLSDPGIRFYAGAQLRTATGVPLGMLCVLDTTPRRLNELQVKTLQVMARQVMKLLDLRLAMREMATMRKEADHRIKNSLQSVASLIRLQSRAARLPETREALDLAQARIATHAALHDLLGQGADGISVKLDTYLGKVCDLLRGTLPAGVTLTARLAPGETLPSRAATVAMILTEWCTNAGKHAFTSRASGTIAVNGRVIDGDYTLTCTDDGLGDLPDGSASKGIGIAILESATAQLGTMLRRLDVAQGTGWAITFPLDGDQS